MPFDYNLMLADDTADWTKANLDSYGTPVLTTKNAGGFAVLDLGAANIGADVGGLAIVLVLTEAATAAHSLTVIVEEATDYVFTTPHELAKFDILAADKGVIVSAETPCTVIRRVSPTLRYLRIVASCDAAGDFKTCWCLASPYPYRVL